MQESIACWHVLKFCCHVNHCESEYLSWTGRMVIASLPCSFRKRRPTVTWLCALLIQQVCIPSYSWSHTLRHINNACLTESFMIIEGMEIVTNKAASLGVPTPFHIPKQISHYICLYKTHRLFLIYDPLSTFSPSKSWHLCLLFVLAISNRVELKFSKHMGYSSLYLKVS